MVRRRRSWWWAGDGELDRHVLVDGYQRVRALGRLDRDLVAAARLELGEAEALMLCQSLDGRGRRSALEGGWFLRELVEGHGLRPWSLPFVSSGRRAG
jgi:hypothetical protein